MRPGRPLTLILFLLLIPAAAFAQLRIVGAGPEGEIQTLEQANEVRVAFSEPMIVLGKIPQPLRPEFFHLSPEVPGEFRWSGTTTLIFRPDARALRYATRYEVRIDPAARSIHGSTLAEPYAFNFTTPTIRLERTEWYAKENGAVVFGLRFNQPIDARALLRHVEMALEPGSGTRRLAIVHPADGAVYLLDPTLRREFQTVALRASADGPVRTLVWSVDGSRVAASASSRAFDLPLTPGEHRIEVRDDRGSRDAVTIRVR